MTGWTWVDPVVGAAIGLFILPRALKLGRRAVRVLIQAAPDDLDMDQLRRDLLAIDGVTGIHDLHAWTLTSEMLVASAHLTAATDNPRVLDQARALLRDRYGLDHATIQVEAEPDGRCQQTSW